MIDSVTDSNDVVVSGSGGSLTQRTRKAQNKIAFARIKKRNFKPYSRPPKKTQANELARAARPILARRQLKQANAAADLAAAKKAAANAARRAKRAAAKAPVTPAAPVRKARVARPRKAPGA